MTSKQQKLIDYAEYVLLALENSTEWSPDLLDDIAEVANHLGLAYSNDEGLFKVSNP